MSAIHYLGRMIRKNAIPVATLAGDAGFSCLSPECHKVSHENDPIHLLPSALTTPFQRAWGGQMSQELLHCLWHIFPTALKSCSPASNTESFNIVPPSTFSPSESRFQPHCQFRRLSIRITKRSTWLVFLGKWNSLLRWSIEISFSCQTEVVHLELLNDRLLSFF